MGKRERYEPGTFCWADLATTDPEGARNFYVGLFGWEAEDLPAGEGGTYTMLRLDGDEVCGLHEDRNTPPRWISYASVEDADSTAERARELGGKVFGEPFDAGGGRIAVIQDPTGAWFVAWQSRSNIGARRVNDPGCMAWNELHTSDAETASAFYSGLFGWETQEHREDGKLEYATIENSAGRTNGGIMPEGDGASPYWLVYFTVPSCDAAAARTEELGGAVLAEPIELGAGRISVLQDPQGAPFAVFEGEVDD